MCDKLASDDWPSSISRQRASAETISANTPASSSLLPLALVLPAGNVMKVTDHQQQGTKEKMVCITANKTVSCQQIGDLS